MLTTLVFSPQQSFVAAPRHLRSVCQGCRRPTPGPPYPSLPTSPPSPLIHRQPWSWGHGQGGGRAGTRLARGDSSPLAQGHPSPCSMGLSWPWTLMKMCTLWSRISSWVPTVTSLLSTTAQVRAGQQRTSQFCGGTDPGLGLGQCFPTCESRPLFMGVRNPVIYIMI